MGAGLVLDILKKGGPYLVIGVLGIFLYIDHLKLSSCRAQDVALTLSNQEYKSLVAKQNQEIARRASDETDIRKKMATLQSRFIEQDAHVRTRVQHILKTAPHTTCEKAIQWAIKQSRSL